MNEELMLGPEQLKQAWQTLSRYRQGKANLEKRIVENEQWYKLRHWGCIDSRRKSSVEPVSAGGAGAKRF